MITLTDKTIDVQQVIHSVSTNDAGALNVFVGTVRNNAKGKNVIRLEFEAYETMAIAEMKIITEEAFRKWPLLKCSISHRVGVLVPGETAVVIAVSCPHRKESFEACQYIIDTLKMTVPIWKKEVFEGGEEWVSAHP